MSAPHPSSPAPTHPPAGWRRAGFWRRRSVVIGAAVVIGLALLTGAGLLISTFGRDDGSSSSTSSAAGGSSGGGTRVEAQEAAPLAGPAAAGPSTADSGSAGAVGAAASVPALQSRVVQTGQLSLEVGKGKVQPTLDRLAGIASGAGGLLASSRSDAGIGSPSGTSTLRVPTARYDAVLAQVRKLGKVTGLSSAARDVTAAYVDLDARIRTLQDTRATFLTLLSRATSIGDTLAVQQQIQPVQQQIEQLQGQQRVLADQSDLATLAVTVTEVNAPIATTEREPHRQNGFAAAWHRTVTAFNVGLQALITILGPLLLIVIVGGAGTLIGRTVIRRRRAVHSYSE